MPDEEKNSRDISDKLQSGKSNQRNEHNERNESNDPNRASENNGVTFITEWTVEIDPNGKRYPLTRRRIAVNESPKVNKPEKP